MTSYLFVQVTAMAIEALETKERRRTDHGLKLMTMMVEMRLTLMNGASDEGDGD